jgi:hypothetical protein
MPEAYAFLNDYCLPPHRRTGHFTNRELTTIAVLAALHFAVSFAARMAGGVLYVFLGPWSTFVDGIGGEGVPCLAAGGDHRAGPAQSVRRPMRFSPSGS